MAQEWKIGDVFQIPLRNKAFVLSQVLDEPIRHTASCAFFDPPYTSLPSHIVLDPNDLIGVATVSEAHLKRGTWRVIISTDVILPRNLWPNEATRDRGWVGAKVYTGSIIEDFLNAYYCLFPWDGYQDPNFFDKLLTAPSKKPSNLIYKTSAWRP